MAVSSHLWKISTSQANDFMVQEDSEIRSCHEGLRRKGGLAAKDMAKDQKVSFWRKIIVDWLGLIGHVKRQTWWYVTISPCDLSSKLILPWIMGIHEHKLWEGNIEWENGWRNMGSRGNFRANSVVKDGEKKMSPRGGATNLITRQRKGYESDETKTKTSCFLHWKSMKIPFKKNVIVLPGFFQETRCCQAWWIQIGCSKSQSIWLFVATADCGRLLQWCKGDPRMAAPRCLASDS